MKIMFYISTLREGGAARVMSNLANQYAKMNIDVIFVTNFISENEYLLDSKIRRLIIEKKESKDNFFKKNYLRIKKLISFLNLYKPDVIVSFMHENDGRAVVAGKMTKTKVILSVRNDPDRLFKTWSKRIIANLIYLNADRVVFQTPEAKSWFWKKIQKKSEIIENPVDPTFFDIDNKPINNLIISCGRLANQKNHTLLIKAIKNVHKKIPNVKLEIYGEGNCRVDLEKLIRCENATDYIELKGATNNVNEVLAKADLFVLSSDYEGMPNALMEAMAAGVSCVSTDCPCGGPRILFGKDLEKYLVNTNDEIQLSNLLVSILSSNKRYGNEMRQRAFSFAPDVIFAKWEECINKLLD